MPYRIGNLRAPVDVSNPITGRLFPRLHWFLFYSLGGNIHIYSIRAAINILKSFERSADSTKEDLACAEKTLSLSVCVFSRCAFVPSNGSSSVGNIKEINQVRGHFSSHHRPGRVSKHILSLSLSLAEKFPVHLTGISK